PDDALHILSENMTAHRAESESKNPGYLTGETDPKTLEQLHCCNYKHYYMICRLSHYSRISHIPLFLRMRFSRLQI
ncbi:MAG: hypothetical protein K2M63_05995, partial [Muribaculaceae bacterium]|nr:hypothetical protein [Muribaculaceae bacterium]